MSMSLEALEDALHLVMAAIVSGNGFNSAQKDLVEQAEKVLELAKEEALVTPDSEEKRKK